jgi:hypothetical protein
MSELTLTLWADDIVRPQTLEALHAHSLTISLIGDSEAIIERFEVPTPQDLWIETDDPSGTLSWSRSPQPLSIEIDQKFASAKTALVQWSGSGIETRVDLSGHPADPEFWPGSELDAAFVVQLISERFAVEGDFWRACEEFHERLHDEPAFSNAAVVRRIGVVGAFWPSDERGLFESRDQGSRRWYGDNAKAMRYSHKAGPAKLVLVVINERDWGGAGGVMFQRPAWTTTYDFDGRWAGMALHELGHSMGLADEYEDPGPGVDFDNPANVSRNRNALDTAWREDVSDELRPDHLDPTHGCHDGAVPWEEGTVGTFEGAFYHASGFYRPSPDCRMRSTQKHFCPVCARAIRRQITGDES